MRALGEGSPFRGARPPLFRASCFLFRVPSLSGLARRLRSFNCVGMSAPLGSSSTLKTGATLGLAGNCPTAVTARHSADDHIAGAAGSVPRGFVRRESGSDRARVRADSSKALWLVTALADLGRWAGARRSTLRQGPSASGPCEQIPSAGRVTVSSPWQPHLAKAQVPSAATLLNGSRSSASLPPQSLLTD